MKTKLYMSILGLITMLFSCGQPNDKKSIEVTLIDTIQTNLDKKVKARLVKRKKIEEEEDKKDSLRLDEVLTEAIGISIQNIKKDRFYKQYEVTPDDEYNVKVEISLDNHFTKSCQHLIIHRSSSNAVYIDIYTKSNNKFQKVVSHEQWAMTYVNDTIQDINGDDVKDFVVNWYGATGCCLKAFSNIYLLRSDKKTFSKKFEFINPSFSAKEKIIRGICYGHPGETEMYKYKWDGEKVDTLEYVSYEKNDKGEKTGKIIISDREPYGDKFKVLKRLKNVPNEYKKIEGFDWFTGKGFE